jgi:DNA-binding CsgD family transcriptional regulator/tetratricopeptide (TPR) repeat protein
MELLERDTACDTFAAALAQAVTGNGQVVLIGGEAGIGKSALVEHVTRPHRATTRVLWGACDAMFTPRPLGPLYDIAVQVRGELDDLLARAPERNTLFAVLLRELQQPTIIIFEDIHWADEATLDLLKFIGRRIQRLPSLLVLTYRDDELGPRHPLRLILGDLVTSAALCRIALQPLSEQAVRRLVGDKLIDAAALHQQTAGNPFFVTEAIAGDGTGVPLSVRDAVLARAARLSISGRAVLEAAAVLGPRIEPQLLAKVVGAEAPAVEEGLAIGMLVAQGQALAFRHELARQAVLDALFPPRKIALHRLVLDLLRRSSHTHDDLTRLAHHAEGAGDREAVCDYAPAAARRAVAASAHREARNLYALALRHTDDLPNEAHARLLEAYAQECNITEHRPAGIAARQKALAIWGTLGFPLKQGENLALLAVMHFGLGDTAEAERVSRAAIELLEALPPSRELALAYRMQATLRMFNRDVDDAVSWGEKAVVLAERFADNDILAGAYNAIGSALIPRDYTRGREALERSLAIAQGAGLAFQVANAYTNLGSASGEVYQLRDAERDLALGIAYCIEHDLDVSRLYMQAWQALVHLHLGRWDAAAELAAGVLSRPGVSAISRIMALVAIGRLRARRGDPGASESLDEALELATQTGHLQRLGPVRSARAEAAWLAGNRERVRAEAQTIYDQALQQRHPWFTGELGCWLWRAGERVVLPAWAARPFALQVAGAWREAAAEWERLGCPYEQALALRDGDPSAQQMALEVFNGLGARPAVQVTRGGQHNDALGECAVFDGLTERERQVAALIARGCSNREIAVALTVGVKTVETYVTRILGKLGFDSRVKIALWAVGRGLSDQEL